MYHRLLVTLLLCLPLWLSAQVRVVDSLESLLATHQAPDSARIQLLVHLGYAAYSVDPNKTEACGHEILDIAENMDFSQGMAVGHQMLGVAHSVRASYAEALEQYLIALSIQRRIGDERGEAQNLSNVSGLFYYQDNLEKALHYNQRALEINRKLADSLATAHTYLARGMIQVELDLDDEALSSFNKSVALYLKLGDQRQLASAYNEIGGNFERNDQPKVALQYYRRALTIKRRIGDKTGTAIALYQLGKSYIDARQYGAASRTLLEGLAVAQEVEATETIISFYLRLAELDSLRGNYKQSLEYYDQYVQLKDSVFNAERNAQFLDLQTQLEQAQAQQEIEVLKREKALNESQLAYKQATINNQRLIVLGGAIGLGLLVALVVILYQHNRTRKAVNLELTRQKEEILAQKEQLEALNRTKDQWFSILGHDFRYPIQFLQHALGLINDGNLNERERNMLTQELEQRAKNTGNLLDNLLYWAQDQTEEISFSPEWVSAHELVENCISSLEHRAAKKGIVMSNDIPANVRMWADQDTTRLAVRNLIDNAIKFSLRGDVVRIEAHQTDDWVSIHVIDRGIGISEEATTHLFQKDKPYTTLGTARERGTGMGLILTKDMALRNHGTLTFDSVAGQGSTFMLSLPRKEQVAKQDQVDSKEEAEAKEQAADSSTDSRPGSEA